MFDEVTEKLHELNRCLENLDVANQSLEEAIKAIHQNFIELKPYLYQPSKN
jgi:chromosome segregation ATPase